MQTDKSPRSQSPHRREIQAELFDVVLKGGRPWGLTMGGGSEIKQALCVTHIESGGKAASDGTLQVGDVIISINDVDCSLLNEAAQLVYSAFRTLTFTIWRGSVESPSSVKSPTFLLKAQEIQERQRLRSQDDSVVFNESKSRQSTSHRMKPKRRGESFHAPKSGAKSSGLAASQSMNTYQRPRYVEYVSSTAQQGRNRAYGPTSQPRQPDRREINRGFSNSSETIDERNQSAAQQLSPAKSTPSLNKPPRETTPSPNQTQASSMQPAKSSPNINTDFDLTNLSAPPKLKTPSMYEELQNQQDFSAPLHVNVNWGGSLSPSANLTTQSGESNNLSSQKASQSKRRSLPPKALSSYRNEYQSVKMSDTLNENLISENTRNASPSLSKKTRSSPEAPSSPPVRDIATTRHFNSVNQSHEKYPSWPVTTPNATLNSTQTISTRAQSWSSDNPNTKEFPRRQVLAYHPPLKPLVEKSSPTTDRKGYDDGKSRNASDPGLKSLYTIDANITKKEDDVTNIYDVKQKYPHPKYDSDGHNLGDKAYNVPSPPERDDNREAIEVAPVIKSDNVQANNECHSTRKDAPSRQMIDSSTSPLQSPNSAMPVITARPSSYQDPRSLSQQREKSRVYLVKQTPYYNTSTQTEANKMTREYLSVVLPKNNPISQKNAEVQVNNVDDAQSSPKEPVKSFEEKSLQARMSYRAMQSGADSDISVKAENNSAKLNSTQSKVENERTISTNNDNRSKPIKCVEQMASKNVDEQLLSNKRTDQKSDAKLFDELRRKSNGALIPRSDYMPSTAPMLRKLAEEYYRTGNPADKRNSMSGYDPSIRSPSSPQPPSTVGGMREAESYNSVFIHPSETSMPFGNDEDWGSRQSVSTLGTDYFTDSHGGYDSESVLSSDTTRYRSERRSLDPSMLLLSRPSTSQRKSLDMSSKNRKSSSMDYENISDYSSRYSTGSEVTQRSDSARSRSSGARSSEGMRQSLDSTSSQSAEKLVVPIDADRRDSNDSVFESDDRTPLSPNVTIEVNETTTKKPSPVNRNQSMKRACGTFEDFSDPLRNKDQKEGKSQVNSQKVIHSRSQSYTNIQALQNQREASRKLDNISESKDAEERWMSAVARSHSYRQQHGSAKRQYMDNKRISSVKSDMDSESGLRRTTSEQIPIGKSGITRTGSHSKCSSYDSGNESIISKENSISKYIHAKSKSTDQDRLLGNSEKLTDAEKKKQEKLQSVREFMLRHSSDSSNSSMSSPTDGQGSFPFDANYVGKHLKKGQSLPRETDYVDMERPLKVTRHQTEWSRVRSQTSFSGESSPRRSGSLSSTSTESPGTPKRPGSVSSQGSHNYMVMSPRAERPYKALRRQDPDYEELPDKIQNKPDSQSSQIEDKSSNPVKMHSSSAIYQNVPMFREPPPVPDDDPPPLPQRNYRNKIRNQSTRPSLLVQDHHDKTEDNDDSYAEQLRKQYHRVSEHQHQKPFGMSVLHTKTPTFSTRSMTQEPILAQEATSPKSSLPSSFSLPNLQKSEDNNNDKKEASPPVSGTMKSPVPSPIVDQVMSSPEIPPPTPPVAFPNREADDHEYGFPSPPPPLYTADSEAVTPNDNRRFSEESYGFHRSNQVGRQVGDYKRAKSMGNITDAAVNGENVSSDVPYTHSNPTSWPNSPDAPKSNSPNSRSESIHSDSSLDNNLTKPVVPMLQPVASSVRSVNTAMVRPLHQTNENRSDKPFHHPQIRSFQEQKATSNEGSPSIRDRITAFGGGRSNAAKSNEQFESEANACRRKGNEELSKSSDELDSYNVPDTRQRPPPVPPKHSPQNSYERLGSARHSPQNSYSKTLPERHSPQSSYSKALSESSHSPQNVLDLPKHSPQSSLLGSTEKVKSPRNNFDQYKSPRYPMSNVDQPRVSEHNRTARHASQDSTDRNRIARHSPQSSNDQSRPARDSPKYNNDQTRTIRHSPQSSLDQTPKVRHSPQNSNEVSQNMRYSPQSRVDPTNQNQLLTNSENSGPSILARLQENLISANELPKTSGLVISHRRMPSQEELECNLEAQELAEALADSDKKLSDVLKDDSKKAMDFMEGIFPPSVCKRTDFRDKNSVKMSPNASHSDFTSPIDAADKNTPETLSPQQDQRRDTKQVNKTDMSPLPSSSSYWVSPARASLENKMRDIRAHDGTVEDLGEGDTLVQKKEELLQRLLNKLEVLRDEKDAIEKEIDENNTLGEKVGDIVDTKSLTKQERDKYCSYTGDVEKIVRLLLKLSGLLARAENAVHNLPEGADKRQMCIVNDKRDHVSNRHEEAKRLKVDIDRRADQVAVFLKGYLDKEEFEDYNYYVSMKSKLTIQLQDIQDNITLGEEQLKALKTSIPNK